MDASFPWGVVADFLQLLSGFVVAGGGRGGGREGGREREKRWKTKAVGKGEEAEQEKEGPTVQVS